MRILVSTDAFPPNCGGSGWSTYELVKTLRARGHYVTVSRPHFGTSEAHPLTMYDGFAVREYKAWAPPVPFVRNYFTNERLYGRYARELSEIIRQEQIDVVHAQHFLSSPASVLAARMEDRAVVCTVRDYWPLCYWSNLIHDPKATGLCPECTPLMMTRCIRPRARWAWPLALPVIPYMRRNLVGKRRALSRADAIIAVSTAIASDLRTRTSDLQGTRVEVIPNPVDVEGIRAETTDDGPPLSEPYAVYVGKLAQNKGTKRLIPAIVRARLRWPVVVVGDGPQRMEVSAEAARSNVDVRFQGWLPRVEALHWLKYASVLIFPSHGPESLSRVLLEAAVLGVPTAAMDTGGTRDIVKHEETGLLSKTSEGLGDDVRRLSEDRELRRRLSEGARDRVERQFAAPVVVDRIEALYRNVVRRR